MTEMKRAAEERLFLFVREGNSEGIVTFQRDPPRRIEGRSFYSLWCPAA
jgi:hypothetical protein